MGDNSTSTMEEEPIARASLALPDIEKKRVAHAGEPRFKTLLKEHFPTAESDGLERLVQMKKKLRAASSADFWAILMREMTDIAGAQCGFVAKRITVDKDDNGALVEAPALGDPGSCLMGTAFYLNGGTAVNDMKYDYRYVAHESPCAHMRHDKVFIIPEKMGDFITNSPNKLPWDRSECFLGIPLFSEGKCFGHFGMIWSYEGAQKRKLSWSFLEMFCHALEDMILMRLLQGNGFAKKDDELIARAGMDAVTASQSLKPYARSLSHELRTPMQGVVGMLDIMHATVMEAIELQEDYGTMSVFDELKANIELVQESSKRAVEAADNVVHAYDLNMEMPDTPTSMESFHTSMDDATQQPGARALPGAGNDGSEADSSPASGKRPRTHSMDYQSEPPSKRPPAPSDDNAAAILEANGFETAMHNGIHSSNCSEYLQREGVASIDFAGTTTTAQCNANLLLHTALLSPIPLTTEPYSPIPPPFTTNLGADHRHIAPRDFIQKLVAQAVLDSHPIETTVTETTGGQETLLKLESPRGDVKDLRITITVHSNVPQRIVSKAINLRWIVMKVIENAFKFTPEGAIDIDMRASSSGQVIDVRVNDTGCGIAPDSQDYIFKPHWQEDATISRAKDGLGLSLFNAKALARKMLKGDVVLVRSETEGPEKGSEFMIRFPLMTSPKGHKFNSLLALSTETPCSPLDFTDGKVEPAAACQRMPATNGMSASEVATMCGLSRMTTQLRPRPSLKPEHDRELAMKLPLRIMVVEDNAVNRMVLQGFLAKLGYAVADILNAYDGVEAVAEFERSIAGDAQKIDLILMDLWMPNMDGYQATETIHKIAGERGLPSPAVIAVTADITSDSLERAKATGMAGYISKPYKVTELQERITDHFASSAMEH